MNKVTLEINLCNHSSYKVISPLNKNKNLNYNYYTQSYNNPVFLRKKRFFDRMFLHWLK